MESNQNLENASIYTELSKVEQIRFKTMTKEEIIEKYIEMKAKVAQFVKEAEFYRTAMVSALREHEILKRKYPDVDKGEYSSTWSWVNKIVYVLKKTGRPLLSPQIIELLLPLEPLLQHSSSKPQAFSPHLFKAVNYGRVVRYKLRGTRGFYYVLPEWMNDQGSLQTQYEDRIFLK